MKTAPISAHDHIKENNRKTWFLILVFPLSFILYIFAIYFAYCTFDGDTQALSTATQGTLFAAAPVLAIISIWLPIAYFWGNKMMLKMAKATQIQSTDPKYKKVFQSVENIALAAGLPTPEVYVINSTGLNAFATGRDPKTASIALTAGIIEALDQQELEGVIAHEMAHIKNRDVRLMMLIITGIGVLSFLASMLFLMGRSSLRRASFSRNKKDRETAMGTAAICFVSATVLMIFNVCIAPIIHMAISRTQEYTADSTGALLTRNPAGLSSALRKISTNSAVETLAGQKNMALACIAPPLIGKSFFTNIFSTHPPIEERIKKLQKM